MAIVFPKTRSRWDDDDEFPCPFNEIQRQTDESNEMYPIRLSIGNTLANRLAVCHCHEIEFPPFEAISFAKRYLQYPDLTQDGH